MRISPDHLRMVAAAITASVGATASEAELVAESLVSAEMRGIPTHGVNFLPMLAERVEQGLVIVPTNAAVIMDEGAVAHIDGGNGLGQVAADLAMEKARDLVTEWQRSGEHGKMRLIRITMPPCATCCTRQLTMVILLEFCCT